VVVISGQTTSGAWADTPEVFDPATNTWTVLTGVSTADMHDTEYPLSYLLPDGRVFVYAATIGKTRILDVAARTWTVADASPVTNGSSVMYRPGKVLASGGGVRGPASVAQTRAAVADPAGGAPLWRNTTPMGFQRYDHNLLVLPDGQVLAVGGSVLVNQESRTGVLAAELWNPETETWTVMASMAAPRMYHSTALLLPDGRVLAAGGGRLGSAEDHFSAELYSPPYLFRGPRPLITGAPSTMAYGAAATVQTPDAATIASVALIRLGSVTHTLDMDQHYVPLPFTAAAGEVAVQSPASASLAPPGYYMLFLVNGDGVPSTAGMVRLGGAPAGTSTPTPTTAATSTPTPIPTSTATSTSTPTPTATAPATQTPTPTPGVTASVTPIPTGTLLSSPTPTPTGEATATATPSATTVPAEVHAVAIAAFSFAPQQVTVVAGQEVRWTNASALTQHTTTGGGGSWDSGPLGPGEAFGRVFDTPGAYEYFCAIHPSMTGSVTVLSGTPTPSPTATTALASPTPTVSPTATRTPTVTRTPTATRTPTVTRTPTRTRVPTRTRTPTRTPTATRTPTVTRTPTRTPTLVLTLPPGAVTVTFDDRGGQNQALDGEYPAGVVDWGSGAWYHSGPWGALGTKSVSFAGPGQTAASFALVAPRRLARLTAYNGGAGAATVTLRCAGQPDAVAVLAAGALATVETGWAGGCAAVTVLSSNGWDTNLDDLVLDSP
jgi:plastocyanin